MMLLFVRRLLYMCELRGLNQVDANTSAAVRRQTYRLLANMKVF
jgi:hypothetical protein